MPSFSRRTASELPTFWPICKRSTGDTISIFPLTIFVAIWRVWKKFVWPGSQSVGPGGTTTWTGATAPTRAGAGTRFASITWRTSFRSPFVKTQPMFPRIREIKHSQGCPGLSWTNCPMILRIIVFFPINTTALSRRAMRICWNCFDPTLSQCTMNTFEYVPNIDAMRSKYCSFFSRERPMISSVCRVFLTLRRVHCLARQSCLSASESIRL
mmetsp:Transcript_10755/g.35628  ORF Transcript_10755/g.35628 Transcript_10755/m.35628 type:complete len:212 (+) Transcript_10755:401-1036(+)